MADKMYDKRGNPLHIGGFLWREGQIDTVRRISVICAVDGEMILGLHVPANAPQEEFKHPIRLNQLALAKSDWVVPIVCGNGQVEGTTFLVNEMRWHVVRLSSLSPATGEPLGLWTCQQCGNGPTATYKASEILRWIAAEVEEKRATIAVWPDRPAGHVPAPIRWKWKEDGEANQYHLVDADTDRWVISFLMNGELMDVRQKEIIRMITAMPETLEALRGLLDQVTGPVMVHGDGRGRDGTKTALSGDEFHALRDSRIAAARDAIAHAAPVVGQ